MEMTQSWERLNDREYSGSLTMGEFEKLLITAGYSTNVAHKAAMQRGNDRLDAGAVM